MLRRLVLAASLLAAGDASADQLAGRVSVIDGDTLELHGRRIRLFGIDAPEAGQTCWTANGEAWRCGTAAARALDDLVRGRTVTCKARDVDRYDRIVAVCEVGGQDLGAELVEAGLALAYRSFSRAYVPAEERAKKAGRGMWNGTFESPGDWRRLN